MLRLTGSDRAIAEVGAIAEHVASLTAAAAALRLEAEPREGDRSAGGEALVPLLDAASAGEAEPTLIEIRNWCRESLDIDEVPGIWRALAHQPRLLTATWRKERLIMAPGILDGLVKTCAALAVACFRQSDYFVSYYTRFLRSLSDVDNEMVVELAGAVMHYVSFNTIAHGMRLDAPVESITASDVGPGGPLEHIVPGVRRRVSAAKNAGS